MKTLRPHAIRNDTTPSTVLSGVGELGDRHQGVLGVVDLTLGAAGVTIAPAGDRWAAVPTLVTWAHLEGFSGDRSATLPDGSSGQVLEIVAHGATFPGGSRARRFVVPAPELVEFFGTLAALSGDWATGRRHGDAGTGVRARLVRTTDNVRSALMGSFAVVAAAVATWGGWESSPRHGQGRRRVGPIAVGLVLVALVAGGATAPLGSAASGAPRKSAPAAALPLLGNIVQAAAAPKVTNLPAASAAPAPAPPSLAGSAPLQSHEIFGYAPYWTLPESAASTSRT